MYSKLKAIYWIVKFYKEKKDFEAAADFYKVYSPEGDERDKNVGASLMSAEQAVNKLKASIKVITG
jgi:hypothetical protein